MHFLLPLILIFALPIACKDRRESEFLATANASTGDSLGPINLRLELLEVVAVEIKKTEVSSDSKGFKVLTTFRSECFRKQPQSNKDVVFTDKLGPGRNTSTEHRIIQAYVLRSAEENSFFCRPGEPATEWKAEFVEFSTSPTRKVIAEVNGVEGRERE